jgi:VWFA-related protein
MTANSKTDERTGSEQTFRRGRERMKRLLICAFTVLLAATLLQGQAVSREEIQTRTRPYAPQAPGSLKVQTNQVEVRVVVQDAKGEPVPGLSQTAFRVFDNGKPQAISSFSVETRASRASSVNTPTSPNSTPENPLGVPGSVPTTLTAYRYLVLFFDDSTLVGGDLAYPVAAAKKFVNENLEPGDRVALFTTSSAVTVDFTDDRLKLLDAIAKISSHPRRVDEVGRGCPRITPYQAFLMANNLDTRAFDLAVEEAIHCHWDPTDPRDVECRKSETRLIMPLARSVLSFSDDYARHTLSVLASVVRYLGQMQGQKVLVLTSSGFQTLTAEVGQDQSKLIDEALHAGIIINSLDARGLATDSIGGGIAAPSPVSLPGRMELMDFRDELAIRQRVVFSDPMALLARGTGGRYFQNRNDLDTGMRELASAPEISYVLGFLPEGLKPDGSFHRLKVDLPESKGFKLTTRLGYFAPSPPAKATKPEPADRLDSEVLGASTRAELKMRVVTATKRTKPDESVLQIVVHVDAHDLPFRIRAGRKSQALRVVGVLFDNEGKYMTGQEVDADLALTDATHARISERGMNVRISLLASAGSYRLRVVTQELMQGQVAALSLPVEIK